MMQPEREAMEKAEWKIVEEHLSRIYNPIALDCDGYHVMFGLRPISPMKNVIMVYINGKMQYYPEACEERRRFHYPSRRSVHTAEQKRTLLKEPKWLRKRLGDVWGNPDAVYIIYKPGWGNFKALKAHLIKHNQSIELLKTWEYAPQKRTES